MKKEDIHLKIFICLLLAFCSGFASCGDDEKEYDPCMPFEVALEKADAVYTEVYTLYGITNMGGNVLLKKVDGEILVLIRCNPLSARPEVELDFYPVNLPESVLSKYYQHDWGEGFLSVFGIIFSGEVKPQLEGMEYNPVVLTYAEILPICNLDD